MASRIGLRMQLMREQVQQEEQRERMQQEAMMHYMQQQQHMPMAPTPAINTPVNFQSPPPVPGEVLKVQFQQMKFCNITMRSLGAFYDLKNKCLTVPHTFISDKHMIV